MYEEAFFHVLNSLHKKNSINQLRIDAGCGMSSVANGMVSLHTPFKEIFKQSAAGGAAYAVLHEQGGASDPEMDQASRRPEASDTEIEALHYHLTEAFNVIASVPMVFNTFFNENEPVVCTPLEALDCFLRTKMDCLVLGDWVVERRVTN